MKKNALIMGRKALVKVIAKESGFTQADVSKILETFSSAVQRLVKSGAIITIKGLCTFRMKKRDARKAFVPQKGHYLLPERYHIEIRPLIKLDKPEDA